MELKTSQKIIRNTVFNTIGHIWGLLASLCLIPYIISKIGMERYGVWVVIGVGIGYLSLLDIPGIGSAFAKYIAEYFAKKDFKRINYIINLGFLYYFVFSLFLLFLVIFFKEPILHLFKFSPSISSEVSFVLIGVLIIGILRGTFAVFRSVLLGLQRMDLTNIILLGVSIPNILGIILFLKYGYGLKGLVYNGIIVAFLTVIAQIFFAYKVLPQIKFNPFSLSKEIFRKSFLYGIKLQVATFAELINSGADKLLLGHYLSVALSGFYEIGAKIAHLANSFPGLLLPTIMPAASELDALKDRERLEKLYQRGTKYLVSLAFPLVFFAVINASLIMLLWMGKPGYEKSILTIQFLTIGYCIYLLNSMGRLIARGMGIPKYEMQACLLIAFSNILLSIFLIIKFGFVGALIGTCLAAAFGSIYFLSSFHRHLKTSFFSLVKRIYLIPLSVSIIASISIWGVNFFNFSPAGRGDSFLLLLIKGIIFIGIYLFLLFKTGYIDKYDREVFFRIKRAIKGIRTVQ